VRVAARGNEVNKPQQWMNANNTNMAHKIPIQKTWNTLSLRAKWKQNSTIKDNILSTAFSYL
jgi:hypothetical protein